jgi:hypothetical protein
MVTVPVVDWEVDVKLPVEIQVKENSRAGEVSVRIITKEYSSIYHYETRTREEFTEELITGIVLDIEDPKRIKYIIQSYPLLNIKGDEPSYWADPKRFRGAMEEEGWTVEEDERNSRILFKKTPDGATAELEIEGQVVVEGDYDWEPSHY